MPSPDEQVNTIASRQWGAFSGIQARTAGLTQRQIDYRVTTKRWRRPARDVYIAAGTRRTWQQQAMTACLAGPPGTVASHLTAAALYGLVKAPLQPHITMPRTTSGRRVNGAAIHRRALGAGERAVKDNLPCTAPVRTVIDCAEVLGQEGLCDLVEVRCAGSSCSRAG